MEKIVKITSFQERIKVTQKRENKNDRKIIDEKNKCYNRAKSKQITNKQVLEEFEK